MNRSRGFTLIELAIVLVVITILIGGLAMPLSAQIQARRIAETKKLMEEAREAIIGYAMGNTSPGMCRCTYSDDGMFVESSCSVALPCPSTDPTGTGTLTQNYSRHYLPCPDTDNDGVVDGTEDRDDDGNCLAYEGWFPSVTLGTAAQDAWGNRLRYAVTSAFSNSAGFSNGNIGDLQICDSSANAGAADCTPGNVASNVVAVVMSHGPNGRGARTVNDTTLADPTSKDERENAGTDHPDDMEFVSRTPSDDFDDLLRWISADQLRGRICPAGGCP